MARVSAGSKCSVCSLLKIRRIKNNTFCLVTLSDRMFHVSFFFSTDLGSLSYALKCSSSGSPEMACDKFLMDSRTRRFNGETLYRKIKRRVSMNFHDNAIEKQSGDASKNEKMGCKHGNTLRISNL